MSSNIEIGKLGEDYAKSHLEKEGFLIIGQNVRSKRWGEIDLIAVERNSKKSLLDRLLNRQSYGPDDCLVFFEVKTRTSKAFGSPAEAVTHHKLRSLKRAAQFYVLQHPELPESLRIDVVEVIIDKSTQELRDLVVLKDAG